MPNLFFNLPVPASDGVGAGVDTSTLGRDKPITVVGSFTGATIIAFSNESISGPFAQLAYFSSGGKKTVPVAAQFMRVRRSGGSGVPNVDVAGNDDGNRIASLPVTAGDGTGASVDVSTLGTFNTVTVLDAFTGTVVIEASEDGVDFSECMIFNQPGYQSKTFTAQFMRVRRKNVTGTPGTPNVDVGASNDSSSAAVSAPRQNFIFRPGGVAVDNVYTDWATLVAALSTVAGFKTLEFDPTAQGSDIVIPVGGPYDMTEVEWFAAQENALGTAFQVVVDIPEGVTFTNLRRFRGDLLVNVQATATVPDTTLSDNETIFFDDGAQLAQDGGTVPLWDGSGLSAAEGVIISLGEDAGIQGGGPLLDLPVANTRVTVNMGVNAIVGSNSISGVATTSIFLFSNAGSSVFDVSQPNFLGTLTDTPNTNVRMLVDQAAQNATINMVRNQIARADTTAGDITCNLPAAAGLRGQFAGVVNEAGANNAVVTAGVGDNVDGAGTQNVAAGARALFVSDGLLTWLRISSG